MLPASLFPYQEPRPFQDELIQRIYTSDRILCDVPTGVGKSVSALCACLADRKETEKVVVLTRTKSQAAIFLRETGAIAHRLGRPILALHLRSKQELCPIFTEEGATSYEEFSQLCHLKHDCPHRARFREGYHDLEAFIKEIASGRIGPEALASRALAYGCPYMVLQRLLRDAEVVVASYMYLLHTPLREPFLQRLGCPIDGLLLILDEAHNLQGLDLMGRSLGPGVLAKASREVGRDLPWVGAIFRGEDRELDLLEHVAQEEVEELYREGVEVLKRRLERGGKKISHAFRVASFLKDVLRVRGDSNWAFFRQGGELRLKPIFPSEVLAPLKEARKLVLMSGTLAPPEGYRLLYGLEEAEVLSLPGVFPRENTIYLAISSGLNTGLRLREAMGEELWRRYACTIDAISAASPGITLVFFPSYEVMQRVGANLKAELEPRSSRDLAPLWKRVLDGKRHLLLAVSGGKLSEGVEFTARAAVGRRSLVGTVVVAGLPFPSPDFEMALRSRRYEGRFGYGRAFTLLTILPMVNRVLQGVGRAVRGPQDRAAVVLLDDRTEYLRYLPEEVRNELQLCSQEELPKEVAWFHRPRT